MCDNKQLERLKLEREALLDALKVIETLPERDDCRGYARLKIDEIESGDSEDVVDALAIMAQRDELLGALGKLDVIAQDRTEAARLSRSGGAENVAKNWEREAHCYARSAEIIRAAIANAKEADHAD